MIDWQFLFLAWELKGKYPAILDQPVARELFDDAQHAARRDHRRRLASRPEGAYGFWPAHAEGDDIVAGRSGTCRFPMLRQQTAEAGRPAQPLPGRLRRARPATTSAGSRWRSTAPRTLAASYEAEQRRLPRDHGEGAGRPAGRGVRRVHPPARRGATGSSRTPSRRWRTCTPSGSAASGRRSGYPASPDHSEKQELFDLLDAEQLGIGADRVVRDDPGRQRQRADLRPPGVAVLHRRPDRPRPDRGLRRPPRAWTCRRGRALAAAQPGLRPA